MAEYRFFEEGTIPECTTPEWYEGRERAPHIDQEMHQGRLALACDFVLAAADDYGYSTVCDLGAGDGGLLSLVKDQNPALKTWGYDLQMSNVDPAVNERGVDIKYGNVIDGEVEWAEISITTEFLEHITHPHEFVKRISERSQVLVASSPWIETPESHYIHHVWGWDINGYRQMIESNGFRVIEQEQTGMFTVVMAVKA